MKSYAKEIRRIMSLIPEDAFECSPGCTDCCESFQCSWAEWDRIEDKRLAHYPKAKCPYVLPETGGCEIYEHRPVICRLFGLVTEQLPNIPVIHQVRLKCPRGIMPKVKLPNKILRDIFVKAADVMNREAVDVHHSGARPYPAGPYGAWIWQDIKQKDKEKTSGTSTRHDETGDPSGRASH